MKQNLCESNRLVAFLDGALSDLEIEELTSHLDECVACGKELEQLAAAPKRWNEVRDHLSRTTVRGDISNDRTENNRTLPFTIRQVVSMLDPTDDPNSMGRLGGYEVLGVVGSGAMGVVLKAVDYALDRVVALKVMNPTLAACGTARYRFAREAKAAAGVLHPNVIAIHGVSTDRELPFLAMPYIGGSSLQQRMDRQGPLELAEVLRVGSQIAAGLAAAHQKGLIHRDIKPSNIMLDEGVETALITDFGLARTIDDATMTRTGAIAGTPEYMSPEQARGDSVDCASDVFSLGSLLYALCTGRRPFRAKTSFGVLRKITDEVPTPIRELNPEIPRWLCKLIRKMHAKSPEERPSSMEVHDQLVACLAHVYQPDRNSLPEKLAKPVLPQKSLLSRTLLIGAITMMTIVLAAIVFAATQADSYFRDPVTEVAAKTSSVPNASNDLDTKDKDSVFKTHKLNFPNVKQKGKLIIDINRGFVEVEGYEGSEVVIEILTPPEFQDADDEDSEFQTLFTPKYDLDVIDRNNSIKFDAYNQDYVLNLRIKVPYRTDMSLDSYRSGYIKAKNVAGVIDTHSEHNDISLLDIAGSATAFSRNGCLKIVFEEVAEDARLDFESYNGWIDLSLPESTAVSTAIASGASSTMTAFTIDPAEGSDRPDSILTRIGKNVDEYQFGKINGGGIPLRLENRNGQIKIRKTGNQSP